MWWHRDASRWEKDATGPQVGIGDDMVIEIPVGRTTEERECSYPESLMRSNKVQEGSNKLWIRMSSLGSRNR